LAVLLWLRDKRRLPVVGFALVWIATTLLPYSFLTYMHRVPSRHVYLASVGLSFIIAPAFLSVTKRFESRPALGWVLAMIIIAHNCAYLWTRKHAQFLERAAPTEKLLAYASHAPSPIYLHCFPYDASVAQLAVRLKLGKEVVLLGAVSKPPSDAQVYCPAGHLLDTRASSSGF
jgi:hypothetical protein